MLKTESYYGRAFRYLARKALEEYPNELQTYHDSVSAGDTPARNLLWASLALPEEQWETSFLELGPKVGMNILSEQTFISVAKMLDNKQIVKMVKLAIHNPEHAVTYLNFAVQNQSRVQSPELVRLIEVPIQEFLRKNTESEINLALDAIGRFDMQGFSRDVESLIDDQVSAETLNLVLAALENQPKQNKASFTQIFEDENLDFNTRVNALHNIVKADAGDGFQAARSWMSELETSQKQKVTSVLSTSNQGSDLLMRISSVRFKVFDSQLVME